MQCPAIREYVRLVLILPPRPDDDVDEAELYKA